MTKFHLRHRTAHAARHVTHSPHHDTKTARSLKKILIIGIVLLTVIGVSLLYLTFATEKNTKLINQQTEVIEALLEKAATTAKPQKITSSLGFSLTYDKTQLIATGQVTDPASTADYVSGIEYDESELSVVRPYSIVKIQIRSDDVAEDQVYTTVKPDLRIVTNIRKDYWDAKLSDPVNSGLSKLDIAVNANIALHQKTAGVVASEPIAVIIGGVPYKRITYTTSSESFGVEYESSEHVYVAVQNDRPYFITIAPINKANANDVGLFQTLIQNIQFDGLNPDKLSLLERVQGRVAGVATASDLPKATTKTPYDIEPTTIINVILRNQPAVVRVAAAYCIDVELLLPDQTAGLRIKNACNAGVGSGSIVSKDGYIATNGHVTTILPSDAISGYSLMSTSRDEVYRRLQSILQYMIDAKIITQEEATEVFDQAAVDNQDAIAILSSLGSYIPKEYIKVIREDKRFAVQTSSEPIKYVRSDGSFTYTDNVIPAKFVASNFDSSLMVQGNYNFGSGVASDVAILKADGEFPVVKIGSIETLDEGDDLTAIGFPAFTDGGLLTRKSKTPPTVTQGSVLGIEAEQGSNYKLIFTNVPIAQGNSGGPSFNDDGEQVGLNTYSALECPDLECFGKGIARDVADYTALLSENNIRLSTQSDISEKWEDGLEAFSEGNYRGAVKAFKKVETMYPAHYLAVSLSDVAISKYGSSSDTSDGFFTSDSMIRAAKILGSVVMLVGIGLVIFLVRGSRKHGLSTHYRTGALPPEGMQQFTQPAEIQPMSTQPPDSTPPTIVQPQSYQQPAVTIQPQQPITNVQPVVAEYISQPIQQPPVPALPPTQPPAQPPVQ